MILSIIVATKGRVAEVETLLKSISGYDLSLIEVLIIDQNVSNFLVDVIEKFRSKFIIKHIKTEAIGASNARNIGIKNSKGKYLCFPDDDCKFMRDTIQIGLSNIINNDVVFGKCTDEKGADSVINFAKEKGEINFSNYSNRFVEATMFATREVMLDFPYDEKLGVGTFHGAEEAYDLVLRLLNSKKKLFYNPEIIFYHPNKILDYSSKAELKRVFSYRCGFAKVCFKHKMYSKYLRRVFLVFFAIPIYVIINRRKARYYLAELLGLLSGLTL